MTGRPTNRRRGADKRGHWEEIHSIKNWLRSLRTCMNRSSQNLVARAVLPTPASPTITTVSSWGRGTRPLIPSLIFFICHTFVVWCTAVLWTPAVKVCFWYLKVKKIYIISIVLRFSCVFFFRCQVTKNTNNVSLVLVPRRHAVLVRGLVNSNWSLILFLLMILLHHPAEPETSKRNMKTMAIIRQL